MSIFLEEPTACTYTLTIEASFLCPLLENTNEIGMIILQDTLTHQTNPPTSTTSHSDKSQLSTLGSLKDNTGSNSDRTQSSIIESDKGYSASADSAQKQGNKEAKSPTSQSQTQQRVQSRDTPSVQEVRDNPGRVAADKAQRQSQAQHRGKLHDSVEEPTADDDELSLVKDSTEDEKKLDSERKKSTSSSSPRRKDAASQA